MPALIEASGLGIDALATIALVIAVAILLGHATWRSAVRDTRTLRPIPAYDRLCRLADQSAESGCPIHAALGAGALGGPFAPEVLMGLTVLGYLAQRAAACDQSVMATTGDGATLAAAQGIVQEARRQAGVQAVCHDGEVQFSGSDPLAYVAGAQEAAMRGSPLAHALWGRFGIEGLWLSLAVRHDGDQLGGAADPAAGALLVAALDEVVLGEDLFAAGAYLHRPQHIGSLLTQDLLRGVIMILIGVGVALSSLGLWGGAP